MENGLWQVDLFMAFNDRWNPLRQLLIIISNKLILSNKQIISNRLIKSNKLIQ